MTERFQIYKCEKCGNIVEILHPGAGALICCDQPMVLMVDHAVDAAKEKHIPVIETIDNGYRVKIGSIPHPMLGEHYIEWVQIIDGDKSYRQFLNPGQQPEAIFGPIEKAKIVARELCNIHGLWKGEN
jgi:superoxide reductase